MEQDRHCIAQINCDSPGYRWATSYHDTRAFPECAVVATQRPPQAGAYSFNNIGLPSFFMLSSTMPDQVRHEKHYYDVFGCGTNIAWHTENDTLEIADRDILRTDMTIYLLSAVRVATEALRAELAGLDAAALDRRNAAVMELSRILVPINYTREARFRHDPAYTVPGLPTLAVAAELPEMADDHMRRVAQTELLHGQNRDLAAIGQARRVAAHAAGSLS